MVSNYLGHTFFQEQWPPKSLAGVEVHKECMWGKFSEKREQFKCLTLPYVKRQDVFKQ